MLEIVSAPMRSASLVISSLSIPTSGLSTSSVVAPGNGRQVFERLRGHLADHLARHQRLRVPAPADSLGDAHHQPAIDHDAERGRDGQKHLLLKLAEGDQDEPRSELMPGQQRGDLRTFSCEARERIG